MKPIIFLLFISSPPLFFLPISFSLIISPITLVILLSMSRDYQRMILTQTIFIAFVLLYSVLVDLFSNSYHSIPIVQLYTFHYLRFLFEIVVSCFVIAYFCLGQDQTQKDIELTIARMLAIFCLIQMVVSIAMFYDVSLKSYIFTNIMRYSLDSKEMHPFFFTIRSFGLANGYFFEFPMLLSMISAYFLYVYSTYKLNSYLIFALLALCLGLINARIAIICPLFYLFIKALLLRYSIREVFKYLLLLVFVSIGLSYSISISGNSSKTIEWISSGMNQFVGMLLMDDTTGTYRDLSSMDGLPTDLSNVLLGDFSYVHSNGISSDIGYVHYIYFGGLFFLILSSFSYMHILYFYLSKFKVLKGKSIFMIAMIIVLFVFMIKGRAFLPNGFNKFMFILFYSDLLILYLRGKRYGTIGNGRYT